MKASTKKKLQTLKQTINEDVFAAGLQEVTGSKAYMISNIADVEFYGRRVTPQELHKLAINWLKNWYPGIERHIVEAYGDEDGSDYPGDHVQVTFAFTNKRQKTHQFRFETFGEEYETQKTVNN